MKFLLALATAAVAGLAFAAPAAEADSTLQTRTENTWTLHNFKRPCDTAANKCTYDFDVIDNNNGASEHCHFVDQGNAQRNAKYSSPSNLRCSPTSALYINVGYDVPGNFYVVVVVNTQTHINAFFGFTDAELTAGNVVSPDHPPSKALVQGTWSRKRDAAAAAAPGPLAVSLDKRTGTQGFWTVRQLHRVYTNTPWGTSYSFKIDQNNGSPQQQCTIFVTGPNTQSWYTLPCQENANWKISWGYNSQYYFAVMTVVE
jgi:hypothetical protein